MSGPGWGLLPAITCVNKTPSPDQEHNLLQCLTLSHTHTLLQLLTACCVFLCCARSAVNFALTFVIGQVSGFVCQLCVF